MRTIEIFVDAIGNSRIETKGFDGSGCRTASRAIEQILGTRVAEQITPEFHRPTETSQSIGTGS